jgi:hypothetical protein
LQGCYCDVDILGEKSVGGRWSNGGSTTAMGSRIQTQNKEDVWNALRKTRKTERQTLICRNPIKALYRNAVSWTLETGNNVISSTRQTGNNTISSTRENGNNAFVAGLRLGTALSHPLGRLGTTLSKQAWDWEQPYLIHSGDGEQRFRSRLETGNSPISSTRETGNNAFEAGLRLGTTLSHPLGRLGTIGKELEGNVESVRPLVTKNSFANAGNSRLEFRELLSCLGTPSRLSRGKLLGMLSFVLSFFHWNWFKENLGNFYRELWEHTFFYLLFWRWTTKVAENVRKLIHPWVWPVTLCFLGLTSKLTLVESTVMRFRTPPPKWRATPLFRDLKTSCPYSHLTLYDSQKKKKGKI